MYISECDLVTMRDGQFLLGCPEGILEDAVYIEPSISTRQVAAYILVDYKLVW
jgi:hypothetical protein